MRSNPACSSFFSSLFRPFMGKNSQPNFCGQQWLPRDLPAPQTLLSGSLELSLGDVSFFSDSERPQGHYALKGLVEQEQREVWRKWLNLAAPLINPWYLNALGLPATYEWENRTSKRPDQPIRTKNALWKGRIQFWTKNPSGEAESQIPDRISKFAGGRGRFGQVWVVSLRTGFPNLGYDLLGRCQGS